MTLRIVLSTDLGFKLNASVEASDHGLVLHSRSGTDRNRDYRKALELIMSRLDGADIQYEVYLDSRPVQHIPLANRRLNYNREASISSRFDELVRSMNADSASHGAWRRLLITTPGTELKRVRSALETPGGTIEPLPTSQLRSVTASHIHRAVAHLSAGHDLANFAPAGDYNALTDDGFALDPNKVFALALEEALGIAVHPGHFSGGWGTVCFELLETAGLWLVPKVSGKPRPKKKSFGAREATVTLTDEERSWIEGNPKIVSHLKRERKPGLAKQKRADFIAKHGLLFCEECGLDPAEKYGPEAGHASIEIHHHRVHVAEMQPGHASVLEDLKCLCANCHRVLHRKLTMGIAALE